MKKNLFVTGLVFWAVFCGNIAVQAQLPQQSTESNPVWYYIQVTGSGATADRVATVVGDKVEGQVMSFDNALLDKQLWRFEMVEMGTESGCMIVNKATKKKLSVTYNATKKLRMATVSDNPVTVWRFKNTTGGYNIYMSIQPSEGAAGDVNLYQEGASQSYALVFTGTSNSSTPNAYFKFVAILDNPVISDDENIVWMYAKNVKTGKYLTDAVASPQGKASFLLEPLKTDGNEIQQWKWIAKSDNNRRTLVNRATGNMVSTDTDFDLYYYLLYTSNPTDGDGWQIERIADNQFAVYSTDAKGIVKYWHATLSGKATESYTKDSAKNSAYAWVFVWAPKGPTGITQPILPDNIRVYASDKRIYVEGCDNYTIFTLQGIPVYRNANLPAGIYLVTMEGKTSKVLVQ